MSPKMLAVVFAVLAVVGIVIIAVLFQGGNAAVRVVEWTGPPVVIRG